VPVSSSKSTPSAVSIPGVSTNFQAQSEGSVANGSGNDSESGNASVTVESGSSLSSAIHSTIATLVTATQGSSATSTGASSAVSPVYTGAASLNQLTLLHGRGALFAIFMAMML
jgi:hypothetical protein